MTPIAARFRIASRWMGKNPAVLVAIISALASTGSAVSACRSLNLNQEVQQRDLMYRELAIRPKLQETYSSEDYSYEIENVGVGPAVIKQFAFYFDGKCYSLLPDERSNLEELKQRVLKYFYEDVIREAYQHDPRITLGVVGIMQADTVIPAGQKRTIMRLHPENAAKLREALQQVHYQERERVYVAFHNATVNAPLALAYCSMTGLYCQRRRTEFKCPQ